jgi:hypothetical protein
MMNAGEIFTAFQNSRKPPLTDADLAQLLKVNPSSICRIKQGKQKPGNKTWQALRAKTPELFVALQKFYYGGKE